MKYTASIAGLSLVRGELPEVPPEMAVPGFAGLDFQCNKTVARSGSDDGSEEEEVGGTPPPTHTHTRTRTRTLTHS
jgi:hypothetical protein